MGSNRGAFAFSVALVVASGGLFAEIGRHTFGGRCHGFIALVPIGGAHFPVGLGELKGIKNTDCFVHITAKGQVVDEGVLYDTFLVEEE